jgi:hypothetical protein
VELIQSDENVEYPNLKMIHFRKVAENYNHLLSLCPNLTKLAFYFCNGDYYYLQCPNITDLLLWESVPKDLSFLSSFGRLKRLSCRGYQPSSAEIEYWGARITLKLEKK